MFCLTPELTINVRFIFPLKENEGAHAELLRMLKKEAQCIRPGGLKTFEQYFNCFMENKKKMFFTTVILEANTFY